MEFILNYNLDMKTAFALLQHPLTQKNESKQRIWRMLLILLIFIYIFKWGCPACIYVCQPCVCSVCRVHKCTSDPLELDLQTIVSQLWALKNEHLYSRKVASALTCWVISLDPGWRLLAWNAFSRNIYGPLNIGPFYSILKLRQDKKASWLISDKVEI